MLFLLHVRYDDTGREVTLQFPTASFRAFHAILLSAQPVTMWTEDK